MKNSFPFRVFPDDFTNNKFWKNIIQNGDNCWPWIGQKTKRGYGIFRSRGRNVIASRLMLFGPREDQHSQLALHKCDNPNCVNPKHLFMGTQKQNMQDFSRKWKSAKAKNSFDVADKNIW